MTLATNVRFFPLRAFKAFPSNTRTASHCNLRNSALEFWNKGYNTLPHLRWFVFLRRKWLVLLVTNFLDTPVQAFGTCRSCKHPNGWPLDQWFQEIATSLLHRWAWHFLGPEPSCPWFFFWTLLFVFVDAGVSSFNPLLLSNWPWMLAAMFSTGIWPASSWISSIAVAWMLGACFLVSS